MKLFRCRSDNWMCFSVSMCIARFEDATICDLIVFIVVGLEYAIFELHLEGCDWTLKFSSCAMGPHLEDFDGF